MKAAAKVECWKSTAPGLFFNSNLMILLKAHSSRLYYCIKRAENRVSRLHLFSMFLNSSKSNEVSWYQHISSSVMNRECAQVETCLDRSYFPFKTDLSTPSPSHPSNADSTNTSYVHKLLSTPFCHG